MLSLLFKVHLQIKLSFDILFLITFPFVFKWELRISLFRAKMRLVIKFFSIFKFSFFTLIIVYLIEHHVLIFYAIVMLIVLSHLNFFIIINLVSIELIFLIFLKVFNNVNIFVKSSYCLLIDIFHFVNRNRTFGLCVIVHFVRSVRLHKRWICSIMIITRNCLPFKTISHYFWPSLITLLRLITSWIPWLIIIIRCKCGGLSWD